MTIAGGIFPLIIGPYTVDNLFIHSLTLCIFSSLLSFFFPSFCIFPSLSPLPAIVLAILLSFLPSLLLSRSIFSPRYPLPRCPLILVQVSCSRRKSRYGKPSLLPPPQSLVPPPNMRASLPYVQTQSSYFSNAAFLLLFFLLVLLSCPPLL